MSKTKIEWSDETWNPVTGCTEVSEGCDHCYAKTFAERFRGVPGHSYEQGFDLKLWPDRLELPLRWKRPRLVFVNSMSDLFHDEVPDDFLYSVLQVMERTPQHTYQVLTKRPGRMASFLGRHDRLVRQITTPEERRWPLPNVWLGTSVETQKWADVRIPKLLETPAAVRFLSCEPLLGPIDFDQALDYGLRHPPHPCSMPCSEHLGMECLWKPVDWVIVGGESGPGARPMHPDWVRSLRDQCVAAGVPFFFKQWGQWRPIHDGEIPPKGSVIHSFVDGYQMVRSNKHENGRVLDGRTWEQMPVPAFPA